MEAFEVDDVRGGPGKLYLEVIRSGHLSTGVYRLAAGAEDPQSPHREDEVYVVASGKAKIRVADEERPVLAGSIVFVGAEVEHRFFDIEQDLVTVVFFAPPESG